MGELWKKSQELFASLAEDLETTPGAMIGFGCLCFAGFMVLAIGFMFLIATLYVIPVWLCWNLAAVPVFGVPVITLFQTYGLVILCTLLLKSFNLNLNFGKK
jgi:hypothetical protein